MASPVLPRSATTNADPHPARTALRFRSRPISVGHLRALEAVARHLNFRLAAEELGLTQSAVSRQVQSLEEDVGVALFLRHTRSVELTSAGLELLRATSASLERIDSAVRMIRQSAGRQTVTVTTWASFASMWLIPRLEAFHAAYPDIDIRIDTTDKTVDLETSEADLAIRYVRPERVPADAIALFSEQLTPVASPLLLKKHRGLRKGTDLARQAFIETEDNHNPQQFQWLTWRRWLNTNGFAKLEPQRWLYFNAAHQNLQAALAGQGVALARVPLVADSLASGSLVEVFPGRRIDTPYKYYLLQGPRSMARPETAAFCAWLQAQAQQTRQFITGP